MYFYQYLGLFLMWSIPIVGVVSFFETLDGESNIKTILVSNIIVLTAYAIFLFGHYLYY